ncbi:unnamed protein product [Effrenium voratum]|uniref:6-phosphofructo-2-kinase domain-containing protein n=1 Tax=Effrenium voratum TaxID=2562239 RepID=A0AA36J0K0_9DINO|nr:unnamed protein product [Effrenium voratum]
MALSGCLTGTALGAVLALLLQQREQTRRGRRSSFSTLTEAPEHLRSSHALHPFRAETESFTTVVPKEASPSQPRSFQRRVSGKFSMNENKIVEQKVVIAMVGLPARGKSYISKAIVRYLNFLGCPTRLFNAGNLRRQCGKSGVEASFFDSHNEEAKRLRDELAMDCLDQVLDFLEAKGRATAVGILDATNTTTERRRMVREKVLQRAGIRLVFLESLCDDKDILQHNYDLKLGNADYKGMSADQALKDFMNRVNQYAEVYEPVQDDECNSRCGYIKLINAGEKLICHRCRSKDDEYGVLRYIFGLMCSINLGHRCIMLAMVGETEHDRRGILGGDSELTELGLQHANAVAGLVAERERVAGKPVLVMCGTLTRHLQTVEALKAVACSDSGRTSRTVLKLQRLNELCAGALDSHSYKELQELYPEEYDARQRDKLNYRYPGVGGESYQDVVFRLTYLVLRLEQVMGNVLVICDKAVCRVLLAYFRGVPIEEMPFIEVPESVITFERSHKGFKEEQIHALGLHHVPGSGGELQQLGRG